MSLKPGANAPKVSVLMPVRNAARYLGLAIESILGQSLANFELLAINDGSTDSSSSILARHAADTRLQVLERPSRGIAASLNEGIDLARGVYIARMDADDIAEPKRLEKQAAYLDSYPDVGLLGTACRYLDGEGRDWGIQAGPAGRLAVAWTSLLVNPFVHPSMMLRASLLREHGLRYAAHLRVAQDYDLFTRMLAFTSGDNLPEALLRYRLHAGSISGQRGHQQLQAQWAISLAHIGRMLPGIAITLDDVAHMHALTNDLPVPRDVARGRAQYVHKYLDLWQAFEDRMTPVLPAVPVSQLRRHVALKAARVILWPPWPPGYHAVLARLSKLDSAWLAYLAGSLPATIRRRLRWRRLRRLHA